MSSYHSLPYYRKNSFLGYIAYAVYLSQKKVSLTTLRQSTAYTIRLKKGNRLYSCLSLGEW